MLQTVVYRRYSPDWRTPEENAPAASADGLLIPGPLIQARVGDHLRIHFKNMDTLRHAPHSMHFHGVHYGPRSDGAYVPGFSGADAVVMPGARYTYRLTAGPDSAGVWPYHDHSPVDDGLDRRRHVRACSRSSAATSEPRTGSSRSCSRRWEKFMTIDGRAFVGNTPVFHAKVGELVQWDVMAMGSDFHTFHVHGHRWIDSRRRGARHADGRPGGVLSHPLARGRSRDVALPLPCRGSHDARHDRDLPGVAVRALAIARRRRGPRSRPAALARHAGAVNIEFSAYRPSQLDVLPGEP